MNTKKEFWFAGGYWLVVWVLPAIILLYGPLRLDASVFLRYFNTIALFSLVLPIGYSVFVRAALPEKLKKLLLYVVVPLILFVTLFISELQLGSGGF